MIKLYTVIMNRQVCRTTYGDGEPKRDVAFVEEKYCDLPYSTALRYKENFPTSFVNIIEQTVIGQHKSSIKVSDRDRSNESSRNNGNKGYKPFVHDRMVRDEHSFNEARTRASGLDSFAEVVNKMVGK